MKLLTDKVAMRRAAMNLLARREHSRGELLQKLMSRVDDQMLLQEVLARLQEDHLLSDIRFAENYIRYRCNRGFGPQRIKMELQTKQVAEEIVAEYLPTHYDDWLDSLRAAWHKKFGPDKPSDYADKMKQMKYMQNKGFYPEHIKQFFAEL